VTNILPHTTTAVSESPRGVEKKSSAKIAVKIFYLVNKSINVINVNTSL